jgi:hypothetical protein
VTGDDEKLGDERDVITRAIDVETITEQTWDIVGRLQTLNQELFPMMLVTSSEGIVTLSASEVTETAIGLLAALLVYIRCTESALNEQQRALAQTVADRVGMAPLVPERV